MHAAMRESTCCAVAWQESLLAKDCSPLGTCCVVSTPATCPCLSYNVEKGAEKSRVLMRRCCRGPMARRQHRAWMAWASDARRTMPRALALQSASLPIPFACEASLHAWPATLTGAVAW